MTRDHNGLMVERRSVGERVRQADEGWVAHGAVAVAAVAAHKQHTLPAAAICSQPLS